MRGVQRFAMVLLSSTAVLVSCSDGGGETGTGPNGGVTVIGLVKDLNGEPVGGATVVVRGKSAATSGPDGRFSIAGVSVPYDVAAVVPEQNLAVVYNGLTRPDPVLVAIYTGPEKTATIRGNTPPVGYSSGKATLVIFIGDNAAGITEASHTTGQYEMTVSWYGSANTYSGHVYLLRAVGPDGGSPTGLPARYDGYASKPLRVSTGATYSGIDFVESELTDPPEQTISGTVTLPGDYTLTHRAFALAFARRGISIVEQGPLTNAFTYTVPVVAGATPAVWAVATSPSRQWSQYVKLGIGASSNNVIVPLEAATRLSSPTDGVTTVGTATSLTWAQGAGAGVNVVWLRPDDASRPTIYIFTTRAEAKISDLAAYGLALPANAWYAWSVYREFPVASVDDAATDAYLELVSIRASDYGLTRSEQFGFKTGAATAAALHSRAPGPTMAAAWDSAWRGGLERFPAVSTRLRFREDDSAPRPW